MTWDELFAKKEQYMNGICRICVKGCSDYRGRIVNIVRNGNKVIFELARHEVYKKTGSVWVWESVPFGPPRADFEMKPLIGSSQDRLQFDVPDGFVFLARKAA